ncbi:MAG: serine/threonine-protein kinase [Myxococcota bacterium]
MNLIDFGEDDGRLFLVMEFIDGQSLTKLIEKEAPFTARRVCDIGIQIAEALAVAHEINVVHRDLKPDNIMVQTTTSSRDFVKILDFGVAKIKRDPGEGQVNTVETKAGLIVGSLRYISPEQVESGEITTRTDMYSFGCVLFEMLARRRVFDYPSPADCAIAHLTEQPKPPVVDGRVLEGPLVDFIMRCLQKKPENRPANGRAAGGGAPRVPRCAAQGGGTFERVADHRHGRRGGDGRAARQQDHRHQRAAAPVDGDGDGGAAGGGARGAGAATRGGRARAGARQRARPPAAAVASGRGRRLRHRRQRRGRAHRDPMDGVRLQPRSGPGQPSGSKAWLWAVIVIVVLGGATAALFVVKPWESSATAPPPVTATREAAADAGPAADAAVAAADDVAPDSAVGAAADTAVAPLATAPSADAETASDAVAAADDAASGEVVAEKLPGVEIVSEPLGATVTLAGKVVGTTPYTIDWDPSQPPPLVRVSFKGYIDVDFQLVKSDRGTRRRVELREQKPNP